MEVAESYELSAAPGAPDPPSSSPGRGVAIGVGIIALIGVVLAVVLLRPSEGETAAGTQRQASTSTAPATTAAPTPSTTNTAPLDDEDLGVFDTGIGSESFIPEPGSIVRTESGFLGLSQPDFGFRDPELFSSPDGSTWSRVSVELANDATATTGNNFVEYTSLIATDDGFALIGIASPFVGEDGSVVQRLISSDGESWRADPDFALHGASEATRPLIHLKNAIMLGDVGSFSSSPTSSTALMAEVIGPESGIDASTLCMWGSRSPDVITAFPCLSNTGTSPNFDEQVRIERSDFSDPTLFDAARACLLTLRVPSGDAQVSLLRPNQAAAVEVASGLAVAHTSLGDAQVAAVFLGDLLAPGESCEAFPEVDFLELSPASVELIDLDSGEVIRRLPLPDRVTETPIEDWQQPLLLDGGDQISAIFNGTAWQLSLETERWTRLGELASADADFEPAAITPDGRVVALVEDGLRVADFATGQTETIRIDQASGLVSVPFVDDEVALVASRSGAIQAIPFG